MRKSYFVCYDRGPIHTWGSTVNCGMGGRLALDLMEPFRPLIADSAVLSAVNTRMVTEKDFVRAAGAVALTAAGRKGFFRAYLSRMDTLVTHPLFDYRVNCRRMLEIQVRMLARVIEGEIAAYPLFVTR